MQPPNKPCKHLIIQTVVEERMFFDFQFSEFGYEDAVYRCQVCNETVCCVDGQWMTTAQKVEHDKDLDSIPF